MKLKIIILSTPKMTKRCAFDNCKNKILSIGINCHKCKLYYYGNHRLPEDHKCDYLQEIKDDAHNNLSATLISQKCVSAKI